MSELTKEYFEQVLDKKLDEKLDKKFAENNKNLVTKQYFDEKLDEKLEEKTKNFVTKEYFDGKVGELVTFKQLGTQLVILENNFDKKLEEKTKNFVTKEYFDEKTKNFVTKEHFDTKSEEFLTFRQFGTQIGIQSLAFSGKLRKMAEDINQHIDESQEELAQMVGDGFVDVITRLDVGKRVTKLEERMAWFETQTQV